ncbi:MAG: transporter [Rhizobiaceae bacterium]|nr:transporter [Rhizobiaceae bacterium]
MNFNIKLALAAIAGSLAFSLLASDGVAEEGGSGHYLPGAMSSFIDGIPPEETFIVRLNVLNYKGSFDANKAVPIAGSVAIGVEAESSALGLSLLWRPPIDLGENWSYAMAVTIPVVETTVSATGITKGLRSASRSSTTTGLGDIILMPLMLNYNVNPELNLNFRIAAYAPTGSYEVGRLANTGKNFWTIEPTAALMYLGKNGFEASVFAGIDFNSENTATNYKSGTQAHIDGTIAQHFPLMGGLAGIGVSGYYYQQITDDSGSGATLGAFRARSIGFGPAISFIKKVDGIDFLSELKWLHETSTENRLEGDTVFFKAVMKF